MSLGNGNPKEGDKGSNFNYELKVLQGLQAIAEGLEPGIVHTVTATAPVQSSGGTNPNISIPAATSTQSGYLTSTDWTSFNNRVPYTVYASGTDIVFTAPFIYNLPATAATANITGNLTDARPGIIQKLYHNHTIAPTVPAGWVLIGSGVYVPSTLNIIYAEWVSGTRVEYWIVQ